MRFVRKKSGEIVRDASGKAEGRGAYLCRTARCVELARKKEVLARQLKGAASEEFYQALLKEVREIDER